MKCEVELKSSHLILSPEIANEILSDSGSVYVAYKNEQKAILVSPKSNTWFPKMHESMEFILKSKDLNGTKSIAIREILIDQELDDQDKMLSCTMNSEKKFLKIEIDNYSEA